MAKFKSAYFLIAGLLFILDQTNAGRGRGRSGGGSGGGRCEGDSACEQTVLINTLESRIIVYTRSMYFEKFPRFTVLFGTYTEPLSRRKILTFHLFLGKFSFEISLHNYIVHNGLVYT